MSRKSRRNRARRRAVQQVAQQTSQQATQAKLPKQGGQLIATAQNDITVPFYSDILVPQDTTIKEKGPHKGLKLYDEVMKDGRAKATLSKRYSKITRREWMVEAASEDTKDIEARDGMEEILNALPFDAICKELSKAILKGFAISEIVWGRNVDGHVVPERIKTHDPSRFVFDKDWNPRLLVPENSIDGIKLPVRKFIVHRFDAEGNNPYGMGLGSVLFWHVLFKREGVSFWMKFLDKFAAPIPFGKYAVGTPKKEQDQLLNSLMAMVQQGALVAPIGTEVSFLEAARSGNASYEEWCRFWDEQTSEVVLGSTLSTSLKGQGSRAASQTHAEETDSIIDDDCDQLSDTLNPTLIKWISEQNWPDANPPTVWRPRPRNESEEEDQKAKRATRQQSEIRSLDAARKQGFEPKDVQDWLSSVFDVEMVPVELTTPQPAEPEDNATFADDDSPIAHLIDQLEELAGPQQQAWLDHIQERLSKVSSFSEASQALLELSGELEIDPMGRVMGNAIALSEITGRSDVFDETGIYPSGARGSKKKTKI
ncbi:Mu-like prophage protein gp29 [Cohaesibacter sp. ES.047]|uniref:DUF935 domain-containing protein n=1 Tax=Cohaesibacter sp. ES.047 TaxID=1798205 RepID=UPI000BB67ADB|nr:DUF935 family protein [Cohaesibacter sp. ES.047]SNY91439.1 Mu-like prophage protein gp29 [Cohaesibacter sp. ES.047]